jgi:patatin-like phospholipase/acyl hydrolase
MSGPLPRAYLLAISGGGDKGAFGAGLLVGWTEAGTRPEFKVVTGVSTGALTAPFAFLGPAYDPQLKEVYTTISADDILERRSFLNAIFGDGLSDSTPLLNLIRRYIDEQMLEAIAEEYSKGRFLLIATTNLDARRSVIWNIGEIAKSGHPEALNLFRRILIASASIPGAFPPVMIDVEANSKRFQEMHVDGGTVAQVFIYPPSINIAEVTEAHGVGRERILYVIRNARLDPQWASVERGILPISARAIESLIQTQGVGDLYVIYLQSQRDDIDYNLAFIPPDFDAPHKESFDTAYMNQLFDYAYGLSKDGYPWEKYPPGYVPAN